MSISFPAPARTPPASVNEEDLLKVVHLLDEALDVFKAYDGGRSSGLDIRARSMVMAVREELLAEAGALHAVGRTPEPY